MNQTFFSFFVPCSDTSKAWTGISLVISLVDYFYGNVNYAVMASNVIIAFALNLPEVQRLFGIRSDTHVPTL